MAEQIRYLVNRHLSSHILLTRQTIRTPDNSFSIKEEPEDDQRNGWLFSQNESVRRSSSPTPPSDLYRWSYHEEAICDLPNGRNSRAGHHTEDNETPIEQSLSMQEEEGNSPPSPRRRRRRRRRRRPLPPRPPSPFAFNTVIEQSVSMQEEDNRAPPSPQQQLLSMDSSGAANHAAAKYDTFQESTGGPTFAYLLAFLRESPSPDISRPGALAPQGTESDENVEAHSQMSTLLGPSDESSNAYALHSAKSRIRTPDKSLPEEEPEADHAWDFEEELEDDHAWDFGEMEISPPDTPMPPTLIPSPGSPPLSPITRVGSPYPHPFDHIRRRIHFPNEENVDLTEEEYPRQWQLYAQNNPGGHINHTTFSPILGSHPYSFTRVHQNHYPDSHPHVDLSHPPVISDEMYQNPGGYTPALTSAPPNMPSYEPISLPTLSTVGLGYMSATAPAPVEAMTAGVGHWQTITSYLHSILLKRDLYKVLLSQTGDQAQSLLNLLHQLLDLPDVILQTRLDFLVALVRLSEKTGLYPECLVLTGLDKVGEDPVAAGSFGEVWQGMLREQEVSVKVVKIYLKKDVERLLKAFYREAILWSQFSHPNILPLYGIYFLNGNRSRLCLVSPWMHHGNLPQYIKNVPDADCATLLVDIAQGLKYLHQHKIVHGDLKGVNILVTPSARACIMDFGLSTIRDPQILSWTSLATSSSCGSVRWQAPELLKGDTKSSFAGDVYAYACVCYEIYSGTHPFSEFPNDGTVLLKVMSGTRPNRPSSTLLSEQMWQLMQHCWLAKPTQRPTIAEVATKISTFPEVLSVEPARNEWDESFPRLLRKSLRGATLSLSLEELRIMLPGGTD